LPVRLNYEYFSGARFNHRQHAIQKNLLGDEACVSCHNARSSTHSTDVMIPDVDRCLQCHAQRQEKDKVTTQCVSCHTYHPGASSGALP
jgi:predicted CXXCH cytochrome family protein